MNETINITFHNAYTIIHRDFVLDYENLKEVKKVEFKPENGEFQPALKVKLNDTYVVFLMLDFEEQEACYKELRKIIMKQGVTNGKETSRI